MPDNDSDGRERPVRKKRERQVVRTERTVREGKEAAWLFLRTLSGVLLAAWLLTALFAPPNPLTFSIWLAASWSVGTLIAIWLAYYDGYQTLADSTLYRPALGSSRSLVAFVAGTIVVKTGGTFVLNMFFGTRPYLFDAGLSVFALALAYGLFYGGVLEAFTGGSDRPA